MHNGKSICAAAAVALLVSGCSTRPRNFTVGLSAPVPSRSAFESDFRTCELLVRQGRNADFKSGAAQVLATGAGALGSGAAMVGTGMVGITTGGAAAAAATAVMPVIGVFVGVGVSRVIRSGKEGKYKRSMDACLTEYGYSVDSWARVRKKEDAARIAADRATVNAVNAMATAEQAPTAGASSALPETAAASGS